MINTKAPGFWLTAFTGLLLLAGCNKNSPETNRQQAVDSLFLEYANDASPGYALGVVENGKLVYSKGYGMGNLETGMPLGDQSAFYIGSMAKQFTAASLLILESEGRVDLNADVRDYLPEFPFYGEPITVNQLIHHTSGLRETNSLQLFQGIDRKFEAVFDTEDLYQLIRRQKKLNFTPGTEFRYSSGGYVVLAKIIERITGMSFREFVDERIFGPLGMEQTLVCDNHNELVPNRVMSYWPVDHSRFERRSQIFDAYGDGGIITTVEDLARWDLAFYKDVLGVGDFSRKMYQKFTLDSGLEIEYARALQVLEYKGLQMITHNGGMLGFRVDMIRFPEVGTSFILLGNSAFLDPTRDILRIADIWLADRFPNTLELAGSRSESQTTGKRLPDHDWSDYEGSYWTDEGNYFRRIQRRNDSLFLDNGGPGSAQYLQPVSNNLFQIALSADPVRLHFGKGPQGADLIIEYPTFFRTFRKFDPTPPKTLEDVEKYEGDYYSDELESRYAIYKENNVLFLRINRNKPRQIFPVLPGSGMVWNGQNMVWIGFGELKFEDPVKGSIAGFTIGDSRVSGVYFPKTN